MNKLVKKLHIYAGLLTLAHLVIYGIAGLVATFQPGQARPKVTNAVRYVPFSVPGSLNDKQVADLVYRTLQLPLTRPMPDWFLRHTPDKDLLLDFYNINGIYRVIVLEREHQLRIDDIRNSNWLFLEDMHAMTLGDAEGPRMVHVWAAWNEVAMWSLLAFCVSGVYLWLSSRPRFIWAYTSLIGGAIGLAAFWWEFR